MLGLDALELDGNLLTRDDVGTYTRQLGWSWRRWAVSDNDVPR